MAKQKLKSPHLLNLGNPQIVINELTYILDQSAIDSIKNEIENNVIALFTLGKEHFMFAKRQKKNWRQKVSRLYYAAYNIIRAVKLCDNGAYNTDISDHEKIDTLPNNLPNEATHKNMLPALRNDRNLCDYDHLAKETDLRMTPIEWQTYVESLLSDVRGYFSSRGLSC